MTHKILICRTLRTVLTITGMWPYGDDFNHKQLKNVFYVTFVMSLFMVMGLIRHLIVIIKAKESLNEDIAIILTSTATYSLIIVYILNQNKIAFLMLKLSDFDDASAHNILNKSLDTLVKRLVAYTTIGIFFHSTLKFFEMDSCEKRNLDINCGFMLPNSTPMPLSLQESPFLFICYYLYEALMLHTYIKAPLLITNQLYEMCQHIILKIEFLKAMVVGCFDEDGECLRRLKTCIVYHCRIIELTKEINEFFSLQMLILLISSSLVLGSVTSYIIQEFYMGLAPLVVCWLLLLFLGCIAGQQLLDASLLLSDEIYSSKWYNGDYLSQKFILMLIQSTQKPLMLCAGKFGYFSFPLFASIIRASYSFVTLLNS